MKMKFMGSLAFALLAVSILSYGVSDSAFATTDPNPALTISSDSEIYSNGSVVTVSGTIGDYDALSLAASDVMAIVKTPDGTNFVTIIQESPSSDGSFEFSFVAGGPLWKVNGDYIIDVKYGADKSKITINYVGGEQVVSTPEPEPEPEPTCGAGTELVNGICQVIQTEEPTEKGGGCLIATAAYGTELAPQVQLLREIRDNTVMSTGTGTSFMTGFNQVYYSFSPYIADLERENPVIQQTVRTLITPMISSLSIMTLAESGNEAEVLGLGLSVIALNLGMYIAAPAAVGFAIHKQIKSRK